MMQCWFELFVFTFHNSWCFCIPLWHHSFIKFESGTWRHFTDTIHFHFKCFLMEDLFSWLNVQIYWCSLEIILVMLFYSTKLKYDTSHREYLSYILIFYITYSSWPVFLGLWNSMSDYAVSINSSYYSANSSHFPLVYHSYFVQRANVCKDVCLGMPTGAQK